MDRAQASLEAMMVIAVLAMCLGALLAAAFAAKKSNEFDTFLSYAQANLEKIETKVRTLSIAGAGATDATTIYFPFVPVDDLTIAYDDDPMRIFYTTAAGDPALRDVLEQVSVEVPIPVTFGEEYGWSYGEELAIGVGYTRLRMEFVAELGWVCITPVEEEYS